MNASEIRKKYLDFQEQKGHKIIAPAPLVLENDPTTLFTGSGMQPLLRFLLGEPHPSGTRLTDSQPCLRLQDIEDVGDPRHTTVFEMLGNWSLGDYFKREQIENYFEFLTKVIGLDPEKIFVTCFIGSEKYKIPKDTEAAEIWQSVFKKAGVEAKIVEIGSAEAGDTRGVNPGERIFFYDDKENWWSRGGGIETTPIGDPCGPDSEVFYDFGEDKQDVERYGKFHPASDGARFMEIGNQVFMQYRRNPDGSFSELDKKNVDFGGGLERLAAASIGSFDVFKTSLMKPIIEKLEALSGKSYENNTDEMRIIADHLRGAYLLSAQGLVPSNKTQGYALRRLIRRAILKALDLGIAQDFLKETIAPIETEYSSLPDSILTHRESALETLEKEEKAFRKTLNKGLKELKKMSEAIDQKRACYLSGYDIFKLQDTYGFPMEISVEEAYREGIELSKDWKQEFEAALKEQRDRSKTASKGMFKGGLEDHGETTTKYHTATHLLLAALQKHISPDICQRGSNITSDRLRFDFNLDHKLSKEELKLVEDQVNAWISAALSVSFAEYEKDYAKNVLKAHGQFWEKYPETLKVYTIGDESAPISREVCGGPHVENTSVLGHFEIKKEESSSAGVRRIKAVLV
ncbi:alanine--tRNA ligase [Candidatus Saccharibacteria bacterium]|nr:alanine--tRNA ligase [Candidatus Saccharibacteria bacterium]